MNQDISVSTGSIQVILEQFPIAALLVDTNGRIVYCNIAASSIFQYSKEEFLSLSVEDLIPQELRDEHIQQRIQFKQSPSPRNMGGNREFEALRKDNSLVPVEVGLNPILIDQVQYVLTSIIDITERKNGEKERQQMDQKIQQTQKLENLGILVSGVAHDFNNILMGITGNTSLLLEDISDDSPIRSQIKQIQNGALKASDLTKQMLAYTGKGTVKVIPVDLSELVEEVLSFLAVSISKGIVLDRSLSNSLPTVMVDTSQMMQVVMNLITNASEAIENGNGMISLTTSLRHCDKDSIQMMGLDDITPGPYICLEVSDTGKGMDSETLENIFDPFYTTKFTGRGLGLSAVRGIMKSHHGCIKVCSEVGKGTTFELFLPANQSESSIQDSTIQDTHQNCSIALIIDDNESVIDSIQLMLEKMNIKVLRAVNGKEGLQLFELHHQDIDLIILDFIMPDLNGDEVLKKLYAIDSHVKVLLSSGYHESTVNGSDSDLHYAGYIQKPFSYSELKALVEETLSTR